MKEKIHQIFQSAGEVLRQTDQKQAEQIAAAAESMMQSVAKGGKILIFGNGGSAADSQHMAAELIGRFQRERRAVAALALTTDTSSLTALSNDYGFDKVFVRQIEALGKPGDVALAISTSGNSANVLKAVEYARTKGMVTVGLTGGTGGRLASLVDIAICVPSSTTARVQEAHECIIHCLCELLEEKLS